jgi:hypothetical protein
LGGEKFIVVPHISLSPRKSRRVSKILAEREAANSGACISGNAIEVLAGDTDATAALIGKMARSNSLGMENFAC